MRRLKYSFVDLYIMILLYVAAGINHFYNPKVYISIIPPWLPYKLLLTYFSGTCEILLALLLVPIKTRRFAAWGIILLLIAVFPANIQMSVNYYQSHNNYFWLTILRLPIQFVLVWWAFLYTRKITYDHSG